MIISEKFSQAKQFVYKLFDIPLEEEISVIEEVEEKAVLPIEYVERFTLYPLQNKDALRDRENELLSLERAYENWKITNQPLLVINESGEGGTSLLHSSTYIYPSAKIIESHEAIDTYGKLMGILRRVFSASDEEKNLNDLQKYINKAEENQVVILENIERLFIRKVNGFNLLEDFLLFLHATKEKIYWIVSVNKYSFYYLDRVKFFASHFPSFIKLNPINNDLLKDEILLRNEGYDLIFLKSNKITKKFDKQLKKLSKEQRQEALQELFFKKLFDFAKGNISKAILYAKESAYKVKEKTVYVKPYDFKETDALTLSELFILEAIFQHRALNISELNVVLRNSNRESRLSIEKLLEKGFIVATKNKTNEVEYTINLMYLDDLKNKLRERLNRNFR